MAGFWQALTNQPTFNASTAFLLTNGTYSGQSGSNVEIMKGELPDKLKDGCLRVSKMLRLPLCGIDLRCTPKGEWYCFEVNPSPGFSFYEAETGQPIADAIAQFLATGQR